MYADDTAYDDDGGADDVVDYSLFLFFFLDCRRGTPCHAHRHYREAKRVQVAESPKATHIMTLWFTNEAGHPGRCREGLVSRGTPACVQPECFPEFDFATVSTFQCHLAVNVSVRDSG